jgi:NAD(P)-dependent dehydrogenase (short-subunit alcohol dehydrogenase family)
MSSPPQTLPPDPDGPVAFVTGASGAAGAAIARTLRAAGWTVSGLDLRGGDADVAATDVTDEAAVRAAVAAVLERTGRVDLLVTAADDRTGQAILELEPEAWQRVLDVHLRGTVHAWRAVLPGMVERGSGAIVAVIPAEGIAGEDEPARSAAASAVLGAVRALAREFGPAGVVVNAVAPKAGAWSPSGDAAPEAVAETVLHLARGEHYFAGQVLSPAGAVA